MPSINEAPHTTSIPSLPNRFPEWNEWHYRFHQKSEQLKQSILNWVATLTSKTDHPLRIAIYGADRFGCVAHSTLLTLKTQIEFAGVIDPKIQEFRQYFPGVKTTLPEEISTLGKIEAILLAIDPADYKRAIKTLALHTTIQPRITGLFDASDANRPPVFLSTMPKAGSNWMSQMLRKILVEDQQYIYCRTRSLRMMQSGTYSWHHFYIGDLPNLPHPERTKTIYLYRDPRDHLVSITLFYKYSNANAVVSNYLKDRSDLEAMRLFLNGFNVTADGNTFDFQALRHTCANVVNWVNWVKKNPNNGIALKYEDVVADTASSLQTICAFLNLPTSKEAIRHIAEEHSFKNQTGRNRGQEQKGVHLRKGKAGDWRNHFDPKLEEEFLAECHNAMQILDYK